MEKNEKIIDTDRERDVQELCQKVLYVSPERYYNPNGADTSTCPFCYKQEYGTDTIMSEIEHEPDCAYLIAKDLSTNL